MVGKGWTEFMVIPSSSSFMPPRDTQKTMYLDFIAKIRQVPLQLKQCEHRSIPSECFLHHCQLEVIFTTVGNSHFLLHYFSVIIFLLIKILSCPSFFPLTDAPYIHTFQ